jgi:hypothetical protein
MVFEGARRRFKGWKTWKKILFIAGMAIYITIFYLVNFKFLADKMFYQPENKILLSAKENKIGMEKLIVGVSINKESKAYPIELIGYHHQVEDTIGGEPVIVTYCSVCRTGRVYSSLVNGKKENFRLVGMDHFNAMFEDSTSKSWWRQVSGQALAGNLKGMQLKEFPSQQMRLSSWLREYPDSRIMQPDPSYLKKYKGLEGFDLGIINSSLEKRDTSSWQFKSWVVGIAYKGQAMAYDWNELLKKRMVQDSLAGMPIMIIVEKDNASFHGYLRTVSTGDSIAMRKPTGFVWD